MSQSRRKQVARAAFIITVISLVGKLLGFLREQVIAGLYGATGLADAYFVAWSIPLMLVGLFGGSISTAFLPIYLQTRHKDKQAASSLLFASWILVALVLTLVAGVTFIFTPLIIRLLFPNFDAVTSQLTVQMLRIMLPAVLFMGTATLYSAVLNAHDQFAWPAVAPLLMNLTLVGATLLLARRLGIVGLAWATLLAALSQQLLLWWRLLQQKAFVRQAAAQSWPELRQVLRLATPIFLGTLFNQVYVFVDKSLASGLTPGSIASLNYAYKLVQLPVSIFVAAVVTAVYPTFARLVDEADYRGLARAIAAGIRSIAVLILPAAVALLILRYPLISLAFERGSFDQTAVGLTAHALAFYAPGLLGVAAMQFLTRGFYALKDATTPVIISVAAALINIVFDILLIGPLAQGGLALANSLAVTVQAVLLIYLLRSRLRVPFGLVAPLSKIIIASGSMGLILLITRSWLFGFGRLVGLALAAALGGSVYLAMLLSLGLEDVTTAAAWLKRLTRARFAR